MSPRWGGSFQLLDELVKDSKEALRTDHSKYIECNVVLEKASHFEVIEK
ncbi:MAG: hypothetical protein ACTS5V_11260 [Giesbergeria sp.]